jgi:hypothetical protein
MKRSKLFIIAAALAFAPLTASAHPDDIRNAIGQIAKCVKSRDANACRDHITASSADLYNRFTGYGLMDCLPQDVTYLSHKTDTGGAEVRAQTRIDDKQHNIRVVLQDEEGEWKLDIPESLRRGIGPKWETQLDATEQVYLMLKSQMGDNLNCTMIRNLGAGLTAAK